MWATTSQLLWLAVAAAMTASSSPPPPPSPVDAFFQVPALHSAAQVAARNATHWQRVYAPLSAAHAALVRQLHAAAQMAHSDIVSGSAKSVARVLSSDEVLARATSSTAKGLSSSSSASAWPTCPFVCAAPDDAADGDVFLRLAQAHLSAQRLGAAAACVDRALQFAPTSEPLWIQLIQLYSALQRADLAAEAAAAASAALPASVAVLLQRAELSGEARDWAAVVRLDASHYYAWGRLGQLFQTRDDLPAAIRCFEEAVAHLNVPAPVTSEVEAVVVAYFNNLLTLYSALLQPPYIERAVRLCERAVRLFNVYRPHFAAVLAQLSGVQQQQQSGGPAQVQAPADVNELFERGKRHVTQNELVEALQAFEAASQLAPHVAATHYAVAVVMKALRLDEQAATDRQRRAHELEPSNNEFASAYLHSLKGLADWQTLEQHWPRFRAEVERGARTFHPFSCLMFGLSPAVLMRESKRMAAEMAQQAAALVAQGAAPVFDTASRYARLRGECDGDGACGDVDTPRLRIGFLSSNFINHAQGAQLSAFFAHNDNSVASAHLYSLRPAQTAEAIEAQTLLERAAVATGGALVDVSRMREAEVAQRIFDDRIDVLVDLCGLADEARPVVLALRPAPVIVSYLGYPATTGAAFVDYYVGDRHSTDPAHFVEQVAFMPHSYQLTEHQRRYDLSQPIALSAAMLGRAAPLFAEGDERVVFCNFNQAIKIDPVVFGVWMRVLKRVAGSVLMLLELPKAAQPYLTRAAASHGVDASRLLFLPSIDKLYHMRRLARCDLLLDTTAYTAHTSCGDALWAGTPVLTIPGPTMAARVATGMLHAAGLGDADLIVADLRAYEERAVALGNDRDALRALKARVGAIRLAEPAVPLFDISGYYRHLMALLRHAWRRQVLEQQPPAQFDVAELREADDASWADFSYRAQR